MTQREWQIGIVGTFDVENYGDLLFPLIAEEELRARLGAVKLHRFSYHAKSAASWPYDVTSVADLPDIIEQLDGLLIGGGFLIRFDRYVADNYGPPSPHIHHPTGYWLTPALMAQSRGIPVAWNAPGMHCNDIPRWAEPLLELALGASASIAVRDAPSKAALSRFVDPQRIEILPDTAFGIASMLPAEESAELQELRERIGLTKAYLVIQPIRWRDNAFPAFLTRHVARFANYQFLALPMGPVLGDGDEHLGDAASRFVRLPFWPRPQLIAELISQASAVIGYSYHLAITALATGVPVFTSVPLDEGKFTALRDFATVHRLSSIEEGANAFFSRLGKTEPLDSVRATLPPLARHWDRIADSIRGGRQPVPPAFARFWQTLPTLMEKAPA